MKAVSIWNRVKENVERATRRGKNISIDFWPLLALIKAMILPCQGNSSPPDIQQQAEHLLHEYELDDETLQKAQLEQHKIFPNFPTSPAAAAPKFCFSSYNGRQTESSFNSWTR